MYIKFIHLYSKGWELISIEFDPDNGVEKENRVDTLPATNDFWACKGFNWRVGSGDRCYC
jgi:hypothetical protein